MDDCLPRRFKNSPMFQRVLDFKKGITAPKVVMDNSQRAMALNVGLVWDWSFVEVIDLFVCEYGSDDGVVVCSVWRGVVVVVVGYVLLADGDGVLIVLWQYR